jgi:type II secretory pathway pseudopilin PulG
MNCRRTISIPFRANAGFTMVEIAIALGVIGFALVAIIGILPAGLEVQRDNRSETIINQDATFWMDAIRSGAQGLDDLTNWVDEIYTPEDAAPFQFGNGGLARGQFSSGYDIISLLTTARRFGETNVQAVVTAFSGAAAEKDFDKNNRDLSFKYRLSVEITNAAPLAQPFAALNQDPQDQWQPLESLYEVRLRFSYPVVRRDREPRAQTFRATVSRNVLTNVFAGREYYLFTP